MATTEDWKALADKEVKGRDLTWHTPEGIDGKPLYTAEDVDGIDPGLPGFAPFTYTGPVSGWATVRSIFSRSATVVRGPICRSTASRVSRVTSSPGSTSMTGGMSGCQRLWPVCGSSRRRFLRSMLMPLPIR